MVVNKKISNVAFVTSDERKMTRLQQYVNIPLEHVSLDLPEIQSLDRLEVVLEKAKAAYALLNRPVLVEDIAVTFQALGNLPGTLIKWFLFELGNDGICELLNKYNDRTATVFVSFALYDGKKQHFFTSSRKGCIAALPKNNQKLGIDDIFIPDGHIKTWSEMTKKEVENCSASRAALEKIQSFLSTN